MKIKKIRYNVAINTNISIQVLEKLSKDEEWLVRMGVSNNPNITIEILVGLSKDEHPYVRGASAFNIKMPTEILKFLLQDIYCQKFALKTLIKKKNLQLFE